MDFGLSQDQQMLRDAVSRCLADTSPLSHVRECAERDNPLSDQVLRALNDLGVAGMLVPEEHGGLGMPRSEEHTSELQSLMRISYAVFCLKKKKTTRGHGYILNDEIQNEIN